MAMLDKMDKSYKPDEEDIREFVKNPIWNHLFEYITETYKTKPVMEYSSCVWPGWNVKFKKSGKNLCTIYPFEGYIWVLVVIGQKEKARFEAQLPSMSPYLQNLYYETEEGMGQRWLKIELEDMDRIPDVKECISIRSQK